MKPFYQRDGITIYCGDCLEIMPELNLQANLCFVDPPYNIGIFSKMPTPEYLNWCVQWVGEIDRLLVPNGAFWVSHKSPEMLVDISRMITACGRGRINWITWDKYNDAGSQQGFMDGYTIMEGLRSFQVMAEYLVYHANEGEWVSKCDSERGFIFEPLRAYLDNERKRAGVDKIAVNVACGFSPSPGGMASRHYFSRSQWQLPTAEHYEKMRRLFNCHGGIEYLRREYEDLRKEYEDLRYTFNNPRLVSSVWQIPAANNDLHPTPKPPQLLDRIIKATSKHGDIVLDPMMGSGTTLAVAQFTGRRAVGIEISEEYCKVAVERLRQPSFFSVRDN